MKTELVFIPAPGMGHLVSIVEMAKLLIHRDAHLSVRVLIIKRLNDAKLDSYIESLAAGSDPRVGYVEFLNEEASARVGESYSFLTQLVEIHKDEIRDYVSGIVRSGSVKLAGIFIDMFCTTMIDLANEFGLPTYVFFPSGAAMLGLMFHMQSLRDDYNQDVTEYKDSDAALLVPAYINPVPNKVLPHVFLDKEGGSTAFLNHAKRYRETKGIVVNTFLELEPHAIKLLSRADEGNSNIPPIYAIGPILNVRGGGSAHSDKYEMIMKWLDDQPNSSVVFLCFGSSGAFEADQVKEIAFALEHTGQRFLWSLRRPPPKDKAKIPSDYENLEEVLPEGFLKRTAKRGKVIGWAPQVAVLSHPAVGGFVSHCGWNSTLESLWCGVPMAAWPMYAEQQVNAFELVKDLGLAVEVRMDYYKDPVTINPILVTTDEIESAIRQLMDSENEIRTKAKEMKQKSRVALMEGGSSYTFLGSFIENVVQNTP